MRYFQHVAWSFLYRSRERQKRWWWMNLGLWSLVFFLVVMDVRNQATHKHVSPRSLRSYSCALASLLCLLCFTQTREQVSYGYQRNPDKSPPPFRCDYTDCNVTCLFGLVWETYMRLRCAKHTMRHQQAVKWSSLTSAPQCLKLQCKHCRAHLSLQMGQVVVVSCKIKTVSAESVIMAVGHCSVNRQTDSKHGVQTEKPALLIMAGSFLRAWLSLWSDQRHDTNQ